MNTNTTKNNPEQHPRAESFETPRTMPGGWDLSALPARRPVQDKHKLSKKNPPSQQTNLVTEIKFSEWQLEWDYFDQVVPPERRDISAY